MLAIRRLAGSVVVLALALLCASAGCTDEEGGDIIIGPAANLGTACMESEGPGACGQLICFDEEPIGGPVCTKFCDGSFCPSNGVCHNFTVGHRDVCARKCQTDAECETVLPGLRCLELSPPAGVKACVQG